MSSYTLRNQIPLAIASLILVIVFAEYFLAMPKAVSDFISGLQKWTVILSAFAMVLSLLSVTRIHVPRVMKTGANMSDRALSAWLLVIMVITILVGIGFDTPSAQYQFIFRNLFSPLSSGVWAIMAFYYCGAILRSFRARSLEATVLVVAGFLVVTRNTPVISAIIPWWESLGTWIMNVPGVSGMRGLVIGVGVGVVAMGIRMLLQMERRPITGEA